MRLVFYLINRQGLPGENFDVVSRKGSGQAARRAVGAYQIRNEWLKSQLEFTRPQSLK